MAINNQNMDRRFSFQEITKSEIKQGTLNLDSSNACQELDLPKKITLREKCPNTKLRKIRTRKNSVFGHFSRSVIKANSDIFTEVIHKELNRGLEVGYFLCNMKLTNVRSVHKKEIDQRKVIIYVSIF